MIEKTVLIWIPGCDYPIWRMKVQEMDKVGISGPYWGKLTMDDWDTERFDCGLIFWNQIWKLEICQE